MDVVDTFNHLIPSDQLDDSLVAGQNLDCDARNEFGTSLLLEDSLKNMLSDKDPMFGSASSQFNPLDHDDANFLIAGAAGLDGLSGALPCPPAAPVTRSVGRPRKHPRVTPPETASAEASATSPPAGRPVHGKPGRPRKKPANRPTPPSSFLIEGGVRGAQLQKELGLGGRVHIQDLDLAGLWLNPVVVLRRLTVTVGGFRIELLPGPSYDAVGGDGDTPAAPAPSLQEAPPPPGGDAARAAENDKAAAQTPAAENPVGGAGGAEEEDVPLGLGPYVNPNDVQATNGTPAPDPISEDTKADSRSGSATQKPSPKGSDVPKPTENLANNKTGSTDKAELKDRLKVLAKALVKPKPRVPTVKNKSLVSRRPKSQIRGPNPPPSSPTKPPQREDVPHHPKSPKDKKGPVSLKRPGEPLPPEQASKVLKVQPGKPAAAKPKSPGAGPVRRAASCDGPSEPADGPKHGPAPHAKPDRTPPSPPGPPAPPARAPEDGAQQEKLRGKKPEKLLQRQKSKPGRAVSVEEPALFVPDNAPAAAKKEPADEQAADGAWDGTNSCGLCKKHHGNMFMVGCGRCDDWFHGDCVGLDLAKVQEMEEEDQMYVCLKCCAEESTKVEPEPPGAAKRPAPSEAEAAPVPEAAGAGAPPPRPRPGPPQALASGGVRPMKKESDRRQSTEVKESTHKTGAHQKHKGSSSAPKKPASAEEIRRSVRDSLKEILLQRLKESDLKVALEKASEVARKTERELFHLYKDTDSKYKSKYRSLMFNLRDSKNNVLFRRVLKGDISPATLSRMSPEELASKELAAWRQRENRHAIEMIEKDQREAERRPITKITHKGEIEIESEEPAKAAEAVESPPPTKALDLPADLIPLEAESSVKVEKDTTGQHKSHLFDLHCKICTGRMAPPVEEAPTKVVKVATTVARRPSAAVAAEETTKSVTATTTAKEDDLHLTVLEESLRNAGSYDARSSYTSAKDEGASFLSTLQCMWRGFVNMVSVAKLVTKAFPVSGALDHLTEDLPDSVQVGGRINPQVVWDYFDKIRATGTKEVCLIRFSPETEEDEISYTLLYAYFSSRKRFGVVSNNLKQVKDMYIIPLGAAEKVPHQLVPFDGPGLESNRPNLLLGLIIRQRPKRDFLPVDANETAAIIPESKPPPAPAVGPRLSEAGASAAAAAEEEEEEAAAKKYLSSLVPARKAREAEKPAGALKMTEAAAAAAEPATEPAEDEAAAEEGEQGSESNKPLRFLPGVLLGWGGELPPLPDFGTKPPAAAPPAEDPRSAKPAALRLDRFVIKKREHKPPAGRAVAPDGGDGGRPAAPVQAAAAATRPGAGVSLRDKPPEVSTESYLAGLPPDAMDANAKESAVPVEPRRESTDGALSAAAARSQTASPKAPLSGILKKSSVYSSAVEDGAAPTAAPTPQPLPAPSGGQNQPTGGPPPATSPLPLAKPPPGTTAVSTAAVVDGITIAPPGETMKDPRVPQAVPTATPAACPPGPQGGGPWNDHSHGVPAAPTSSCGAVGPVVGAPQGPPASQGPGDLRYGPLPGELQTPPAQQQQQQQQNHSTAPLHSPPPSHAPPSPLQQNAHPEPAGRPSPSGATAAAIKDYKRPEDRYSDPWERPRHADDHHHHHHHHRDRHGDKRSRHQDKHRERSRHRGHSEERRKERHHSDEHGGRHKDRHRHRRDSDHDSGRRSSRDGYS